MRARPLILSALFCALTAVGAFLTVPIPYGSITLQLFFVLLCAYLLPPRSAFFSQLAYVLLGLTGAPVFAGFTGGLSAAASPTFGFLIGMAASAPLVSALYRKYAAKKGAALLCGLAGLFVVYLCGVAYGCVFLSLTLSERLSALRIARDWCLIYLPFDLIKLFAASSVSGAIRKRLSRLNP